MLERTCISIHRNRLVETHARIPVSVAILEVAELSTEPLLRVHLCQIVVEGTGAVPQGASTQEADDRYVACVFTGQNDGKVGPDSISQLH